MLIRRKKKAVKRSPSNYLAPKWVDELKPGDKVRTSYPVSPYAKRVAFREVTIKQVIFQAMTASGVAVVIEEEGDTIFDIEWIDEIKNETASARFEQHCWC